MRAQVAVEELERKLGIQSDTSADGHDLLDPASEPVEPPD
jgi:hypothetical protein